MKPFRIFLDGQELTQYTGASLSRKKEDLTGQFQCEVFFNYMPSKPVMVSAMRGKDVTVYVGGQLAFFGSLDKRKGKGVGETTDQFAGSQISSSIEPNSYNVSLSARGKTKYLIEGSHQHKTGTLIKPTTRKAVEELLKGYKVELDWKANTIQLERVTFRDGNNVIYELQRIANENGHYFYEGPDGRLIFEDMPSRNGDDLILGKNILRFSADQSEEHDRSRIVVKGQRTSKTVWGEEAVLNVMKSAKKGGLEADVPFIVQHYGDATPEALDRRAKFEADKRNAQSLRVNLEVFHVQTPSGAPWDLGTLHYVEVPPEGVFNVMECVEVNYTVDAQGTLKTALTLAPPPSSDSGKPISDKASMGGQRRAQLGVNNMDVWQPSDLQFAGEYAVSPETIQPNFTSGLVIGSPPTILTK
jgi:prophage tail gpP-like protein